MSIQDPYGNQNDYQSVEGHLTSDLFAYLIQNGKEAGSAHLDADTRVRTAAEAFTFAEPGWIWFYAWHPDTNAGPYYYRASRPDFQRRFVADTSAEGSD